MKRFQTQWKWWRYTWWFQLAHGPLCDRHKKHVLCIGRLHLCRSCTCLYIVMAISLVLLMLLAIEVAMLRLLLIGFLIAAITLSYPPMYERFSRSWQDVVRGLAGMATGVWLATIFQGEMATAVLSVALALPFYFWYRRLRQPAKCSLCNTCPELGYQNPCSGYMRQVDAIKHYELACEASLPHEEPPSCVLQQVQNEKLNRLKK